MTIPARSGQQKGSAESGAILWGDIFVFWCQFGVKQHFQPRETAIRAALNGLKWNNTGYFTDKPTAEKKQISTHLLLLQSVG